MLQGSLTSPTNENSPPPDSTGKPSPAAKRKRGRKLRRPRHLLFLLASQARAVEADPKLSVAQKARLLDRLARSMAGIMSDSLADEAMARLEAEVAALRGRRSRGDAPEDDADGV